MYIVESDFEYKGYRCVVIFGDMLYRCGYVGLPEGHHLYDKSYTIHLDIKKEDMAGVEIGKRGIIPWLLSALDEDERIRMDAYFNVHGGLTYGGGGNGSEYPVESDLWWLGFDCGHAGDKNDVESAKRYWPDDDEVKHRIEFEKEYCIPGEIRTKEYCEEECKSLVDQIIEYTEGMNNTISRYCIPKELIGKRVNIKIKTRNGIKCITGNTEANGIKSGSDLYLWEDIVDIVPVGVWFNEEINDFLDECPKKKYQIVLPLENGVELNGEL